LTTIVAFGSLVSSEIVPVIDFGWMMCLGIAAALAVAFTLFPAAVMVLGRGRVSPTAGSKVKVTAALGRFTDRHTPGILATSLVVAAIAAGGIRLLSVENSFVDYFDEDTEIYRGMTFIDEHLGGTMPLDVLIGFPEAESPPEGTDDPFADPFADPFGDPAAAEGDADRYWYTPAKISLVEDVHAWLDAQPETGKVLSIATLHEIAKSFNDGRSLDAAELALVIGAIPEQYKESLLAPFAAPKHDEARVSVRMLETNRALDRDAFLERVRRALTNDIDLAPERVQVTGLMVLYNNMLQSLFSSQLTTVFYVAAGILVTFVVLFRSLLLGLLGLLPNGLAAASVLALMGYLGIPLDVMTITIAAIVIGIGVDHTIHYVHRFRQELPRHASYRDALHASHNSIGHALYYTAVTIIVGFSVLVLSNFNPSIYFGAMTAASMALALLANLTLLPALLAWIRPLGPPGERRAER